MDRTALETELQAAFDAGDRSARVVARQAQDLSDSGRVAEDLGMELSVEVVVSNLEDAPGDYTLLERWNWWLGSLELSHGGYEHFRIRPGAVDDDVRD